MNNISQRRRPNPMNQIRGKINRAQGNYFEELIETSCAWYQMSGTAVIDKVPEPFHILKPLTEGRFIGNFKKKAQADFAGTLYGGRSIKFDAKSTQNNRISQSEVTDRQWEDLDNHEKMGALCFIFVSIRMQEFFIIPWHDWKQIAQRYGRKYITLDELRPYEVRFDGQKINFLDTDDTGRAVIHHDGP